MSLGEPGIEHAQGEYLVVIQDVPSSLLPQLERSLGELGLGDNLTISQSKFAPDDCDSFTVDDLSAAREDEEEPLEMRRPMGVLDRTISTTKDFRLQRVETDDGTVHYLGDTAYTLGWLRLNKAGMITTLLSRFLKQRSQQHRPAQGKLF